MKILLVGVILNFFVHSTSLYFHAGEREEKCIIEDIPNDTLIIARFKMQQWDLIEHDFLPSAPGLGMVVTITAPNGELLLSKVYGPEATATFTSHTHGEHSICLQSNSTRLMVFAGSKLRIHLDIQVGEHLLDETIAQAKDKVNEVILRIEHLNEQIKHIMKEQNYQREREEFFRLRSEDTNSNVLWWAVLQTIILMSVGVWQIKCFKDFLIAKKLV
ncbi:transmembrane emp24 domain-containing protein 11-like [Rhinatrema bivittatum]|uniref:transmembrane emp24 domain-containing protein 11-like n=1 Tax=Rhinatrema bivittatum TaxID=194408 RepID=UPI0011263E73|nr:transmembrane emp24 domain-containing protein 11-like [Rhinatrema bivittatum]